MVSIQQFFLQTCLLSFTQDTLCIPQCETFGLNYCQQYYKKKKKTTKKSYVVFSPCAIGVMPDFEKGILHRSNFIEFFLRLAISFPRLLHDETHEWCRSFLDLCANYNYFYCTVNSLSLQNIESEDFVWMFKKKKTAVIAFREILTHGRYYNLADL